MILVVLIVIMYFLLLCLLLCSSKKNRRKNYTSREDLKSFTAVPLTCMMIKAGYDTLLKSTRKRIHTSFGDTGGSRLLKNLCYGGKAAIDKCDTQFSNPMDNIDYTRLCCNSENNSKCNIDKGVKCTINKSKLYNIGTPLFSRFNDTADNEIDITNLKNYCTTGKDIMDSDCNVDDLHPKRISSFKRYCCNESDDPSVCGPEIIDKCIVNVSKFLKKSANITNVFNSPLNLTADIASLTDLCTTGIDLINKDCKTIDPLTRSNFKTYCCNGSDDPSKCNISNLECIINKARFTTNTSPTTWNNNTVIENNSGMKSFCTDGIDLINKCNDVSPLQNNYFKRYCCDGSSDATKCIDPTIVNADSCVSKNSKFVVQSKDILNYTTDSILSGSGNIRNFCTTGLRLMSAGCTIDPMSTTDFRNYCCNGSSDRTKCVVSNVDDCILNQAKFTTNDALFATYAPTSATARAMVTEINHHCAIGNTIISNGCSGINPATTRSYNIHCVNRAV